ncbi:MAG: DUF1850 domain-containing protein [Bacillus sp. (in: Bacteria)]|nr:DUF1850 domain-containing protein [Bacillus sp. (in: firmicutes)]
MNNNVKNQQKRALLGGNVLFQKMIRVGIFVSLFFILLLLALTFINSPYRALVILDDKTEEILWQNRIENNEWFSHQYIHSVERSPVLEKFRVDSDGVIYTMESWTKSFGAGLPHTQEGTVELRDGYYILKDLNRPVHGGVLLMQPSAMFPHSFYFQEQEVMLSEAPFAGTRIRIEVVTLTWLEVFLDRVS